MKTAIQKIYDAFVAIAEFINDLFGTDIAPRQRQLIPISTDKRQRNKNINHPGYEERMWQLLIWFAILSILTFVGVNFLLDN
jgi:hypothetical protein